MRYWIDLSDPDHQLALACQSVAAMLLPEPEPEFEALKGVGTCRAWSELLIATLGSQGVDGARLMRVFPEANAINSNNDIGFLVKDWAFSGSGTAPEDCEDYTFVRGQDMVDSSGVAGQGVENPRSHFNLHFIVFAKGSYYDPSYGAGPFRSSSHEETWEAWEVASIDAFFRRCGSAGDVGRRKVPGNREVFMSEEKGALP